MDGILPELSPFDEDEAIELHFSRLNDHDAAPRAVVPPHTLQQIHDFLETAEDTAEDTVSFLLRLYNDGTPLFTKETFRDAADQLDRCLEDANSEHTVSLVGLDGTPVHFCFRVGQDVSKGSKLFWPGCKIVTAKPRLDYHGLFQLMSTDSSQPGGLGRAYLPIDIVQETEIRDVKTGELIVPWLMLNHEEVRERFYRDLAFWKRTVPFSHLRWLLGSTGITHSIKNVVAFGCGTITRLKDQEIHQRSTSQHAVMLEVRDFVKKSLGVEVQCFAQDPAYTSIDKQVLGELGITVLDDPRAWLQVENGSVVIAIEPTIPTTEIIADIAKPGVIIMPAPPEE
ncbi:hypothetical protein F5144DRAFT_555809 [Chaetomium tenue]|uniref:Uncharacterized protein n=1 Tax=Chaetomium tenue TaxID=1854479 RepID=A0ACB7PRF8_9PEZI|nr:hypothetical protein F5144DRAFT_555809 [Chaetomium globosum]